MLNNLKNNNLSQLSQRHIRQAIKSDLWICLLDIIAVNAAYYLALIIRYYVSSSFQPIVSEFFSTLAQFAPVYTISSIIVFWLWKLYGGMWRFAGINDMNRIIGANLCTLLIQVFGTSLFLRKMPIGYYVIGGTFQFFFIAAIRFAYRLFVIERKQFQGKPNAENAIVIGVGDVGRAVLKHLEESLAYKPIAVIATTDSGNSWNSGFAERVVGRAIDGVPIKAFNEIEDVIKHYEIKAAFIGEVNMNADLRKRLTDICSQAHIELKDTTSYLNYIGESDAVVSMPPASSLMSQNIEDKNNKNSNKNNNGTESDQGRHRHIPFSPPDITESEISEVIEALRSGWITTGPRTKHLERRLAAYIETGETDVDTEADIDRWKDRVVCLNSATAAEELNLRILGVREGDEVIVPAYTYTASASAVIHCGATVKFVDIQKDGDPVTHMPEMDYEKLEQAITEKTKAIIVVDLGGIVADYEKVFDIVERKRDLFRPLNLSKDTSDENSYDGSPLSDLSARIQKALGRVAVLSDSAHSLGASRVFRGERKYCGAIADLTSFSFHAVKNFTTAEGGASTWRPLPGIDNSEIYKMYQLLSLHGQNKDALAKTKIGAWEYDIIGPWYKCNMTDIMAAIGLRQLDRYHTLLNRRVEIMKKYDAVCDELNIQHLVHHTTGMDSSNHLYLIRIPGADVRKRNEIIEKLARAGVSSNVHYKPLPMMTAYGKDCTAYPNAYDYYQNLITLPLHTLLSDDDVDYICSTLKTVIKEKTC